MSPQPPTSEFAYDTANKYRYKYARDAYKKCPELTESFIDSWCDRVIEIGQHVVNDRNIATIRGCGPDGRADLDPDEGHPDIKGPWIMYVNVKGTPLQEIAKDFTPEKGQTVIHKIAKAVSALHQFGYSQDTLSIHDVLVDATHEPVVLNIGWKFDTSFHPELDLEALQKISSRLPLFQGVKEHIAQATSLNELIEATKPIPEPTVEDCDSVNLVESSDGDSEYDFFESILNEATENLLVDSPAESPELLGEPVISMVTPASANEEEGTSNPESKVSNNRAATDGISFTQDEEEPLIETEKPLSGPPDPFEKEETFEEDENLLAPLESPKNQKAKLADGDVRPDKPFVEEPIVEVLGSVPEEIEVNDGLKTSTPEKQPQDSSMPHDAQQYEDVSFDEILPGLTHEEDNPTKSQTERKSFLRRKKDSQDRNAPIAEKLEKKSTAVSPAAKDSSSNHGVLTRRNALIGTGITLLLGGGYFASQQFAGTTSKETTALDSEKIIKVGEREAGIIDGFSSTASWKKTLPKGGNVFGSEKAVAIVNGTEMTIYYTADGKEARKVSLGGQFVKLFESRIGNETGFVWAVEGSNKLNAWTPKTGSGDLIEVEVSGNLKDNVVGSSERTLIREEGKAYVLTEEGKKEISLPEGKFAIAVTESWLVSGDYDLPATLVSISGGQSENVTLASPKDGQLMHTWVSAGYGHAVLFWSANALSQDDANDVTVAIHSLEDGSVKAQYDTTFGEAKKFSMIYGRNGVKAAFGHMVFSLTESKLLGVTPPEYPITGIRGANAVHVVSDPKIQRSLMMSGGPETEGYWFNGILLAVTSSGALIQKGAEVALYPPLVT